MRDLILPEDFSSEIKMLRQIDAGQPIEYVLRYLVVMGACLGLAALAWDPFLVWGGIAYVSTNVLYLVVLTSLRSPIPPAKFYAAFLLCALSSFSFGALCVYAALVGTDTFLMVGFCGIAGMGLYNLRRHNRMSLVALFDLLLTVIAMTSVGIGRMLTSSGWIENLTILATVIALAIYYCFCFLETLRSRMELQKRLDNDIAQSRLQAIANLTAGVAHDFNNLLTVIRGNVELAEMLPQDADRQSALTEAKEACDRAAHLVTQLMAFARKSRMQPKVLPLKAFVDDWKEMAVRLLPATIDIETRVPAHARAFADATLLEAALLNVAINTRDALDGATGALTVTVETGVKGPLPDSPPYVRLTLADTGPGAAPEVLAHMTEPFFTTKPVGQGTGLGLSMIKGFVEQAGGELSIENMRRGGLAVAMTLPSEPIPEVRVEALQDMAGIQPARSPAE